MPLTAATPLFPTALLESEPLRYGSEVYRTYDQVRDYAETWLCWAAVRSEHLSRCEGTLPSENEIRELMQLVRGVSVWLFSKAQFHRHNVDLLAGKCEQCREWARGLESRQSLVDLFEALFKEVAAHSGVPHSTGTPNPYSPKEINAATLSMPLIK